jgi:hypothetical protein
MKTPTSKEIAAAIKLLKKNGFGITEPPPESEYEKAIRTGVKPAIWPPIVMTREELNHFRATHGMA